MSRTSELTFDPGALSAAQRVGDSCVVCHKKWPRPRARVGRLPDGSGVFACADCAPALPVPRAVGFTTDTGLPVSEPAAGAAVGR